MQKYWILADSSRSVALWGSGSIISAFHSVKCRKMEISIAQNVAGQIQELLQISYIFFCKLVCIFLAFFSHFNFSSKNGVACFCIFLHPDF